MVHYSFPFLGSVDTFKIARKGPVTLKPGHYFIATYATEKSATSAMYRAQNSVDSQGWPKFDDVWVRQASDKVFDVLGQKM